MGSPRQSVRSTMNAIAPAFGRSEIDAAGGAAAIRVLADPTAVLGSLRARRSERVVLSPVWLASRHRGMFAATERISCMRCAVPRLQACCRSRRSRAVCSVIRSSRRLFAFTAVSLQYPTTTGRRWRIMRGYSLRICALITSSCVTDRKVRAIGQRRTCTSRSADGSPRMTMRT